MNGLKNHRNPFLASVISWVITAGLAVVAIAWALRLDVVDTYVALLFVLAAIWSVAAAAFRCATCDKSIYFRDLNPWGPKWNGVLWATKLFPEKTCSRCGSRLSDV